MAKTLFLGGASFHREELSIAQNAMNSRRGRTSGRSARMGRKEYMRCSRVQGMVRRIPRRKRYEWNKSARRSAGIQGAVGAYLVDELPRKQIEARKGSRASHKEGVTAPSRRFCLTSRQVKEGNLRACACKYKGLISRTYGGPMEV